MAASRETGQTYVCEPGLSAPPRVEVERPPTIIYLVSGRCALVNDRGQRWTRMEDNPASSFCDPWPCAWHTIETYPGSSYAFELRSGFDQREARLLLTMFEMMTNARK